MRRGRIVWAGRWPVLLAADVGVWVGALMSQMEGPGGWVGVAILAILTSILIPVFKGLRDDMVKFREHAQKCDAKLNILEVELDDLKAKLLVAIITSDLDGRIVEATPSAVDMFGYSLDELIGLPVSRLIHPRWKEEHHWLFKKRVESGEALEQRIVNGGQAIDKHGRTFPVSVLLDGCLIPRLNEPGFVAEIRRV